MTPAVNGIIVLFFLTKVLKWEISILAPQVFFIVKKMCEQAPQLPHRQIQFDCEEWWEEDDYSTDWDKGCRQYN